MLDKGSVRFRTDVALVDQFVLRHDSMPGQAGPLRGPPDFKIEEEPDSPPFGRLRLPLPQQNAVNAGPWRQDQSRDFSEWDITSSAPSSPWATSSRKQ